MGFRCIDSGSHLTRVASCSHNEDDSRKKEEFVNGFRIYEYDG